MCIRDSLKTGDRGEIDELNRLKLTGRVKELFKTSKGKYVAPAPIENMLKDVYKRQEVGGMIRDGKTGSASTTHGFVGMRCNGQ